MAKIEVLVEVTGPVFANAANIPPTGKRVTITGISIHRIASGKIIEEWQQWDSLGLMQQLGVVPTFKFGAKAAYVLACVTVVKSRSIRGEVKDIFLPRPEGEDISLPSSPCA